MSDKALEIVIAKLWADQYLESLQEYNLLHNWDDNDFQFILRFSIVLAYCLV